MENLMNIIFEFIAYFILFHATSIGRKDDSKIITFDKHFWIIVFLLSCSVFILKITNQ